VHVTHLCIIVIIIIITSCVPVLTVFSDCSYQHSVWYQTLLSSVIYTKGLKFQYDTSSLGKQYMFWFQLCKLIDLVH